MALPLLPTTQVPDQDGSASAPGTVRRLAGKFEWGTEGRVQAADTLEPSPPGGVDVNGERETPQGNLTGSGSQENGTPGKLGWAQSSSSFSFSGLYDFFLEGWSYTLGV